MNVLFCAKKLIPEYQVVAAAISTSREMVCSCWQSDQMEDCCRVSGISGGKVEEGENDLQALQREIMEELDTHIRSISCSEHINMPILISRWWYGHTIVSSGTSTESFGSARIAWVRCDEMNRFAMGKVDRLISRDLCSSVSE